MIKKIASITAALSILSTVQVSAQTTDNSYYLAFNKTEGVESKGIAAGFDKNNILTAAVLCDIIIGNEICSTEFEINSSQDIESFRIYFPATGTAIKNFLHTEKPAENIPEKTPTPDSTTDVSDNTTDITDNTDDTDTVSKYPTELDAATAFMVVEKVETILIDDSPATELTVLYHGEETTIAVPEDITVSFAPDASSELLGEPASSLKAGDVIYCSTNMSGKLRTVELIYRPQDSDIVSQDADYGKNFEKLFTSNSAVTSSNPIPYAVYGGNNSLKYQYAFGVIKEKGKLYMELCSKDGLSKNNINIDLNPNTVVYVYDNSKRKDNLSAETIADIEKTFFDSTMLDDDENVINWDGISPNYALVRMSNGTALDVVVYINQ